MSLNNVRKKLSMNNVSKLKTCPNNPAFSCVFEPPNSTLSDSASWPSNHSKFDLDVVDDITVSDTSTWSQSEPHICPS